jgi:hypothetical protein
MNAVSGISRLLMIASLGLAGGCISNNECDGDDDCNSREGACTYERCGQRKRTAPTYADQILIGLSEPPARLRAVNPACVNQAEIA